ncbi:hypothetical protein [Actinophytocola sp.]|uniref:hypothetical protein n=1 Tax=Actinophytocola sp. TaxID=1872138 RepID=UPI00389B2A07
MTIGVSFVSVGCGADSAPASPPASTSVATDPALLGAADTIGPMLEKTFPDSYAGLSLDHRRHVMTVYRRPDPALDAAVRAKSGQVRVDFRDAKFSLAAMRQLVDRIMADRTYWGTRQVSIQTVAPMPDGSGVRVGTLRGAANESALLSERYGAGTVSVEKISVVPD